MPGYDSGARAAAGNLREAGSGASAEDGGGDDAHDAVFMPLLLPTRRPLKIGTEPAQTSLNSAYSSGASSIGS